MGQQFGISKEHGRDKKKKKYHPVLIFLILTYGKTSKMPNEKKNNFWAILFLKTNYIACSNEKIGRNGLIKKKMFMYWNA